QPDAMGRMRRHANGDDLHARRYALEYLRRYATEYGDDELFPALAFSAGHEDRGLRQAAAALLAALDEKNRRPADLGLLNFAQERKEPAVAISALLAASTPDLSFKLASPVLSDKQAPTRLRIDATRLLQRGLGDVASPE